MSQTGTVLSVGPRDLTGAGTGNAINDNAWTVQFSYTLDAGGTAQAQIVVNSSAWTGPNSTITVSPNPTGTTNPIVLACPPLIAAAAFGAPLK
jgi:hypothetical protein